MRKVREEAQSTLAARSVTNDHGSDVAAPIHHAKPERRTHERAPHRLSVPRRSDIRPPQQAVVLRRLACEQRRFRGPREPVPRQRQAAPSGIRRCEPPGRSLGLRCRDAPEDRTRLPARLRPVHWQQSRSLYACCPSLSVALSPATQEPSVRSINEHSAGGEFAAKPCRPSVERPELGQLWRPR